MKLMNADFKYKRLDKDKAALLMVDHQTGLLSLVRDSTPEEFKNNVLALADTARFFDLPTILTTSFEEGPNGPIMPELKTMHQSAPHIARPGEINAWDNDDFVQAVKKTGCKQLIFAGIVTEICVAYPVLSAIEAGYDVFVAIDASGTQNDRFRDAAISRMVHAGAQMMNWFSISGELQRDWRNDVEGYGNLVVKYMPSYAGLMGSYNAQTGSSRTTPRKAA